MGKFEGKTTKKEKFFVTKSSNDTRIKPSSSSSGNFFVTSSEKAKILETKAKHKGKQQQVKPKANRGNFKSEKTKDANSKKPFDKKKWRMQKYSKKYKLEQWENKRKKIVLQEYYKQIKDEESGFDVQKIYEKYDAEDENENNLNKDLQQSKETLKNVDKQTDSQKTNKKVFKKPHAEFNRIREENKRKKEEIAKEKVESSVAKKQYKAQKLEKLKKLNKKTKKGQPIMKYRMEMLLEQIQKSMP